MGHVVLAGMLTMALCLSIHAIAMFAILKTQVWFRRRFPGAHGISLIVPSILLATVVMVISSGIQICIWSALCWTTGHFNSYRDALYFSGTTYTTLGTGERGLAAPYRAFEPIEAMNGMLAAGLNTAILFAILANFGRRHSSLNEFFE